MKSIRAKFSVFLLVTCASAGGQVAAFEPKVSNPYSGVLVEKVNRLLIGSFSQNPASESSFTVIKGKVVSELLNALTQTEPGYYNATAWDAYLLLFVDEEGTPLAAFKYLPVGQDGASAKFYLAVKQGTPENRSYFFGAVAGKQDFNYVKIPEKLRRTLNGHCEKHRSKALKSVDK